MGGVAVSRVVELMRSVRRGFGHVCTHHSERDEVVFEEDAAHYPEARVYATAVDDP